MGKVLPVEYRIEAPALADTAALLQLRTDVWREEATTNGISRAQAALLTYDWSGPEAVGQYTTYLQDRATRPWDYYVRVAKLDLGRCGRQAIVGVIDADVSHRDAQPNFLAVLQLRPGVRGRGLGRQLVDGFEAALERQDNHRPIELETMHGNVRAQRFYERLGYQMVAGSVRNDTSVGAPMPMLRMRKDRWPEVRWAQA